MLTDPVTNPTSATGRIIFAIGAAILTVLIRVQANLPGGVVYSILLMNILTPTIERITDGWQFEKAKKYAIYAGATFMVGALLIGGVATQMTAVAATDPETEEPGGETPTKPPVTLGAAIGIFDDATKNIQGEVLEQTTDGDQVTYIISSRGYAVLQSDYENTEPNQFEVVLNTTNQTIVSVKVLEMKDTTGIGDKINDDVFLDQYKGLSYADETATVDAASGATVSSVSANRAVRTAIDTAKGGE
jgi:electron transport complex protein RnfD